MVSSIQSPTATASTSPSRNPVPSPSRRRDGRQPGSSSGAFGLFRRKKIYAFSRNNRKSNTNETNTNFAKERDGNDHGDGVSCSSVEKMMTQAGGSAITVGVEARIDNSPNNNDQIDDLAQVVQVVEKTIRQVLLYCIVFIAATKAPPEIVPKVAKLLELSSVAWGTCLVISVLGWMQSRRQKGTMHQNHQSVVPLEISTSTATETPIESELHSTAREAVLDVMQANQQKQNQYLDNLYIMLGPKQRIHPNTVAVDIDTELFSGKLFFMVRTPDADEGVRQPSENPIVTYFRGKQRRFEFQWQLKLKKIPQGDVFFCAELDEPVHFGVIQRALTSTALKFVKKTNPGFSYYLSESHDCPSYLSFPVGTSMDRFTATKPGQPLPELGKEIVENKDDMKERKKGKKIDWNLDDVYTMSLWSAYLDWVDWQLMNFPGVPKLAVTSVAGVQPIKLTLFTTPGGSDLVAGKDLKRQIDLSFEVSNPIKSTLGPNAKEWVAAGFKSEQVVTSPIQLRELDVDEKSTDIPHIRLPETFDEDSEDSVSDGDTSDEDEDIDVEEIDEAFDANVDGSIAYLRSGSPVFLRESIGSFLSIGGGYAVLQSSPTNILIEKIHAKKKFSKASNSEQHLSSIIRSGDVVRVKLVDASTKELRYLTLHRGWWLRWSTSKPQKSGSFFIQTNDPNNTPISLDSPFSLQSRKWSRYHVGAMQSSSVKFGGRMLGLYKPPSTDPLEAEPEDDLDMPQQDELDNKGDSVVMPLLLRADAFGISCDISPERIKRIPTLTTLDATNEDDSSVQENQDNVPLRKRYELDVPVYIEMMNRTNRTKQRVYAVRVKEHNATETNEKRVSNGKVTMKLRTGRSLASVLRIGLNDIGNKSELPTSDLATDSVELDDDSDSSSSESDSDDESQSSNFLIAGPNHSEKKLSESDIANAKVDQVEHQVDLTPGVQEMSADPSPDTLAPFEEVSTPGNQSETSKRKRGTAVIVKVAKTLKSSSVVTGKHVIKHSKNIGKGTVNAGRAAGRNFPSSVVHSKPPKKHEPKGRVARKKSDYHAKALVKAMKRFDGPSTSGQLLAPDQMCRKVSHLISDISSLALPSERTTEAIFSLVTTNSQSDVEFLRGGSAELGVIPLETINVDFDCEFVVARSIWEGRWREEVCTLYSRGGHLSFYAPLTKKPSLVVSFAEIISVRRCKPDMDVNPLPGLHILAIDTAWRCHYLAFLEAAALESFSSKLKNSLHLTNDQTQQIKAREWETFQLSLESALTGTIGPKWASVSTGRKSHQKKQRRILNGRRMSFDLKPVSGSTGGKTNSVQSCIAVYSENLLKMALTFSPDTLDATESSFIEFLDEVSRLRSLPLHEIDFTSRGALCIFVNLYHCLLQHSLLIAVDGVPDKRSVTQFKRRSCYEIGNDVFSLSELESLVIRGKTRRPSRNSLPFVAPPRKSRTYIAYALDATDYRINFVLNNGDTHYPLHVPVLAEKTMDDQIDAACQHFLLNQVEIDTQKTTVVLPKVCDVYKSYFGNGDVIVCLSQCLRYLDVGDQLKIAELLENGMVSVKFRSPSDKFHTHLASFDDSLYVFSP
ncbi:hypothetical protein ACHAWT_008068 [Skeletonema menzelii]